MKYCRFQLNGEAQYGLVESVAGRDSILRILLAAPEESDGDVEGLRSRRIEPIALEEARLLAPVSPTKIVCVGRNYREHAAELGSEVPTEPLLFFKPNSALLAPGGVVKRPKISQRVDYEGELCVVMGKSCHLLRDDEDVRPFILGYTCLNDVTMRDIQRKEDQWARAKGFDTSCPVGPVVVDGLDPWAGRGCGDAGEWRGAAVGEYEGFYFSAGCGDPFYLAGDDAVAGRSDCDGNAGGRGSGGGGGCDGGERGGSGDA